MKRARLLLLLAGPVLLTGCGGHSSPDDRTAFAMLDANQSACDPLADGIVAAYRQAMSAGAPPDPVVRAYLDAAGADAAAELQAGLPFAQKAIETVAPEEGETRNLLVDWQERQSQFCGLAAGTPKGDDLKTLVADHDRVQKAIREARAKLAATLAVPPAELTSITKDRAQTVRIAVKERRGEQAAKTQLAAQRAAREAAEAAEAQQLVAEDQAREDQKKRLKVQEEEDREALVNERRAAEELEIRMKRERQEKTMRERQAQGVALVGQQFRAWATAYRQQIEPFARNIRAAQRPSAVDVCPALRHAADGVRIPQAPDPNLQEHLNEAFRLASAAADSCGQKLKDTTAFRLQLILEHLATIERQLPSGS